jgi:hypothetical protein
MKKLNKRRKTNPFVGNYWNQCLLHRNFNPFTFQKARINPKKMKRRKKKWVDKKKQISLQRKKPLQ